MPGRVSRRRRGAVARATTSVFTAWRSPSPRLGRGSRACHTVLRAGAPHKVACLRTPAHRAFRSIRADQTSLQTKSRHTSPFANVRPTGLSAGRTTRDRIVPGRSDQIRWGVWTTCRLLPTLVLDGTSGTADHRLSNPDPLHIGDGTGHHCSGTQGIAVGFIGSFCDFFCSGPGRARTDWDSCGAIGALIRRCGPVQVTRGVGFGPGPGGTGGCSPPGSGGD